MMNNSAPQSEVNYSLGIDFFKVSSRIGRTKHLGAFSLWFALILWGAFIPEWFPQYPSITQTVTLLFLLLGVVNILLSTMKRLNDFNFRGVWVLFCAVPFIGFFWYVSIFMIPGSVEENRYGLKPDDPSLKTYMSVLVTPITLLLIYLW